MLGIEIKMMELGVLYCEEAVPEEQEKLEVEWKVSCTPQVS